MPKQTTVLTGREKLIYDLHELHDRMRPIVVSAGVQDSHYDAPFKNIEEHTNEVIESLLVWLREFEAGPYRGAYGIWRLKPPEWWVNMETLFGQRKTREHKLLKVERKKLRAAWYKRYGDPDHGNEAQGEKSISNSIDNDSSRSSL
jgi:hypothetical protein